MAKTAKPEEKKRAGALLQLHVEAFIDGCFDLTREDTYRIGASLGLSEVEVEVARTIDTATVAKIGRSAA